MWRNEQWLFGVPMYALWADSVFSYSMKIDRWHCTNWWVWKHCCVRWEMIAQIEFCYVTVACRQCVNWPCIVHLTVIKNEDWFTIIMWIHIIKII